MGNILSTWKNVKDIYGKNKLLLYFTVDVLQDRLYIYKCEDDVMTAPQPEGETRCTDEATLEIATVSTR